MQELTDAQFSYFAGVLTTIVGALISALTMVWTSKSTKQKELLLARVAANKEVQLQEKSIAHERKTNYEKTKLEKIEILHRHLSKITYEFSMTTSELRRGSEHDLKASNEMLNNIAADLHLITAMYVDCQLENAIQIKSSVNSYTMYALIAQQKASKIMSDEPEENDQAYLDYLKEEKNRNRRIIDRVAHEMQDNLGKISKVLFEGL